MLYLANSRESIVGLDCVGQVQVVPCDPDR